MPLAHCHVMFRSMYCSCHYLPLVQDLLGRVLLHSGLFLVLLDGENSRSEICVLLLAVVTASPVACFVLSSGFLLLKNLTQFDQAHILLSLWLPDCRCFTLIIKSMYCCRHCLHSCRWFKITGIHGCGSPTRKGTTALGIVPCSALFQKFTITGAYLLPSWLPKLTLAHIHVQINVLKYTSYRPTC